MNANLILFGDLRWKYLGVNSMMPVIFFEMAQGEKRRNEANIANC